MTQSKLCTKQEEEEVQVTNESYFVDIIKFGIFNLVKYNNYRNLLLFRYGNIFEQNFCTNFFQRIFLYYKNFSNTNFSILRGQRTNVHVSVSWCHVLAR